MGYRIQNRRDTAARWAEMNPILLEGEIGLVTDNANQYKIGDGIHAWNDLPLRGFTGTISQELGEDENAVVSQKVVTEKLVEADGKLAKLGSEVVLLKGEYNYSDNFEPTTAQQIITVPVSIKQGQTVEITSSGTAIVTTFRIWANEAWSKSLDFTDINESKIYTATEDILYLSVGYRTCSAAGTFNLKVVYPNSIKTITEILDNTDEEPTEDSNHLVKSGGVFSRINQVKSQLDQEMNSIWGDHTTIVETAITSHQYIEIPCYIRKGEKVTITSYGNIAASTYRIYGNETFTNNTGFTNVNESKDYIPEVDITKLIIYIVDCTNVGEITINLKYENSIVGYSNLPKSIAQLKSIGDIESGVYQFTTDGNKQIIPVYVKKGQSVRVKISTNKTFTRFMIGFNDVYIRGIGYVNFYNDRGAELTYVAEQDLTSLWFYLVSASDYNIAVTWSFESGVAFLKDTPVSKFDGLCVMPSMVYALSVLDNSIYFKNIMKYEDGSYFINPVGRAWKYHERKLQYKGNADTGYVSFDILDTITMERIERYTIPMIVADKTISTPKVVNCIGDSFTYNGMWYQHIADNVNGLTFVGMRKSYNAQNPLRAEGRGGWTLAEYFEPHGDVTPTHMQPFSPFMHVDGYTYYGVIDFWKVIVNGTSQYTYGTNGFDDYASWFNADGYKLNPSANDLMYDGINNKYVYYNGSSWVDYSGTPTFAFNYAKYIRTWNITSPDIIIIMLGKNDFQGDASEDTFNDWKDKLDTLIASVRSYATSQSKSIIIGICTPSVANEAPNNSDFKSQLFGNRNMWEARRQIIATYDNDTQKNNNVYVVDSGVCLDPLYGFDEMEIKPFDYYEGDARELFSTNGVHPSNAGYKQIGTCVGGFIQSKRS